MELNTLTVTEAQKGLAKKKFSSFDLVSACFARISEVDTKLHAFLALTKEAALKQAKEVTATPSKDQPLLGIPFAVKDNFNTEGLETTAASNILKGYIPPYDATVVAKLKAAGAIILGKTNLDAFAHGSSTETSDFGPTLNPWNTDYLPGGSSGGAAAAIVSDETIGSIGSETAGSVRGPAAWCGCVGLKPTYGRVSRYGLIAMASSTDCPGPLAKNVADAKLVLELLSGFDPHDATSSHKELDLSIFKPTKQLKIGLPKQYFRSESQSGINEAVLEAARVLETLGAKLVEVESFDPTYAVSVYTILQRSEVSSNLARFDGIRFGKTRDQFNAENKRRIMLGTYTLSAGYYDAYYKKAQQVRTLIVQDFTKLFGMVDLLLAPTLPSVAPKKGATEGEPMWGELADILTEPSSIAGLPGISLPCGFINGLPVGMQLIGPQFSEAQVLATAADFEKNTDWHRQKPAL